MIERIILNDQGLYVDCIIKDGRIFFKFAKGLELLNNKVEIRKENDVFYALLGIKKFIKIARSGITRENSITTTELRILCAIANRIDYLTNNGSNGNISLQSEFERIITELKTLPETFHNEQTHHSELHTHFTEILNAEEFIDFINRYNVTYPINEEGKLDFKSNIYLTYEEIIKLGYKQNIIDALRLDVSRQSSFSDLTSVVNDNRRALLQRIINNNSIEVMKGHESSEYLELDKKVNEINEEMSRVSLSNLSKKEKGEKRKKLNVELEVPRTKRKNIITDTLYDELLVACLEKLKRENIEYSEISFSNANRLRFLGNKHKDDDSFNFLYSIRRDVGVDKYKIASTELESLLETGKVIGADIMGHEVPLVGSELTNFKNGIMHLLPVLHIHPNSLLRLHASEFRDTCDNLLESLRVIDNATEELDKACMSLFGKSFGTVPPPRIRIGHGVNINENPELISYLKKYDVVVEINISSNYALGQISSLKDVPIDFYKRNGIKYVLSTDGGGVYSTSLHQEENLVFESEEDREVLNETEKEQIRKGRLGAGISSKENIELYKKLKPELSNLAQEVTYSSYLEALEEEDKIRNNRSEEEFVNFEMENLSAYIMDLDPNFDYNYYRDMISLISKLNSSSKSDIAKIYLFLLEQELFPERITAFKTLHFLSNNKIDLNKNNDSPSDNDNPIIQDEYNYNLDMKLYKLFEIVKESYEFEKESMRPYGINEEETKRR